MRVNRCWAARVFGILLVYLSTAQAANIEMLAEDAPPFIFVHNGIITGLGVETVEAIANRTDTPIAIKIYPWARAYRMAQENNTIGIFITARNAQREKLFQWVGPVHTSITAFYGKRGSAIRLRSLADARAVPRILVPREWYSHQLLRSLGFTNLHSVDTPQQMAWLVLAGRAEVMVATDVILPAIVADAGGRPSDFQVLYPINKVHGYIAFSLATPREIVQRWQRALDEMKRDGSFSGIYRKWLPGQTPPGLREDADATVK